MLQPTPADHLARALEPEIRALTGGSALGAWVIAYRGPIDAVAGLTAYTHARRRLVLSDFMVLGFDSAEALLAANTILATQPGHGFIFGPTTDPREPFRWIGLINPRPAPNA